MNQKSFSWMSPKLEVRDTGKYGKGVFAKGNIKKDEKLIPGDTITFTNNITNEQLLCEILFVHHYDNIRKMLETEGTKNVLSSGLDIEGGIKSYNSLDGYEEGIKKHGIYAVGVKKQ